MTVLTMFACDLIHILNVICKDGDKILSTFDGNSRIILITRLSKILIDAKPSDKIKLAFKEEDVELIKQLQVVSNKIIDDALCLIKYLESTRKQIEEG